MAPANAMTLADGIFFWLTVAALPVADTITIKRRGVDPARRSTVTVEDGYNPAMEKTGDGAVLREILKLDVVNYGVMMALGADRLVTRGWKNLVCYRATRKASP